jgi:hypothetical protein
MAKYIYNEIKNKKYHIVGTILKSNRIITETGNIHTPGIHIYIISFMGAKLPLGHARVFHK